MALYGTRRFGAVIGLTAAFGIAVAALSSPAPAQQLPAMPTGPSAEQEQTYQALKSYLDSTVSEVGRVYQALAAQLDSGAIDANEYNRQLELLDQQLYGNTLGTFVDITDPRNMKLTGCTVDGYGVTLPVQLRVNMDQLEARMAEEDVSNPIEFMNEFTSAVRGSFTDLSRVAIDELSYSAITAPTYQSELRAALSRAGELVSRSEQIDITLQPGALTIAPEPCREIEPDPVEPEPEVTVPNDTQPTPAPLPPSDDVDEDGHTIPTPDPVPENIRPQLQEPVTVRYPGP